MQYKRWLSTLKNFSFVITTMSTCLMVGVSESAETVDLRDTLSDAEINMINEMWRMGALHKDNIDSFWRHFSIESLDDPDRLSKALKGDFPNRARRELLQIHAFLQDPSVGLPREHWFLLGLIPLAIVSVIWRKKRHSITKGSTA